MTEPTPKRRSAENEDMILYTGGADVREITAAQWEAAGVENQDTVVFNRENNHRVPLGDLTGPAADLLLEGHKREFAKNNLEIPAPNGE